MKGVMAYHTNAYMRSMRAVRVLHERYDASDDTAERIRLATQIKRRIREAERHERYIEQLKLLIRDAG